MSFHAAGLDEYSEPTPVDATGLRWEVSDGLGTVAPDGAFTAGPVTQASTGQVTAHYGDITVSAQISVLPGPSRLVLAPAQSILAPGSRQQFSVRAFDSAGNPVTLSPGRVVWNCAASPSALSPRGLFCAPLADGAYPVIARVGDVSAQAQVIVGPASHVVQDFEKECDANFLSTPAGVSGGVSVQPDPDLKGNSALRLSYDFSTTSEPRAAYALLHLDLPDTPLLALRVYGDGQGAALMAAIRDATGRVFDIELAPEITWDRRWQEVMAWLPKEITYPISLSSLYVSETRPEAKPAGALFFDDIAVPAATIQQEPSPNAP